MSTGQVFLALGAILLFSITALNVNRTYLSALEEAILIQSDMDAVQYGQSLADEVASNRPNYDILSNVYAGLNNVTVATSRRQFVTPSLDTLFSTITVGTEAETLYGIMGRTVTVTVFSREADGGFRMRSTYTIPVIQPD